MRKSLPLLIAVLACLAWGQEEKTIGYLGKVTQKAGIYAEKSSKSRQYFPARPGADLVIQRAEGPWLAVVMIDGRVGWIKAHFVNMTDYVVVQADPQRPVAGNKPSWYIVTRAEQVASRSGSRVPYVWGGNSLTNGVDCSGFVKQLFGEIGAKLPRTAAEQAKVGLPITRYNDLQPGDRVYFWNKSRSRISHTGIITKREKRNGVDVFIFTHSARSRGGVTNDILNAVPWRNMIACARR